jgi:hypothetical protein
LKYDFVCAYPKILQAILGYALALIIIIQGGQIQVFQFPRSALEFPFKVFANFVKSLTLTSLLPTCSATKSPNMAHLCPFFAKALQTLVQVYA